MRPTAYRPITQTERDRHMRRALSGWYGVSFGQGSEQDCVDAAHLFNMVDALRQLDKIGAHVQPDLDAVERAFGEVGKQLAAGQRARFNEAGILALHRLAWEYDQALGRLSAGPVSAVMRGIGAMTAAAGSHPDIETRQLGQEVACPA